MRKPHRQDCATALCTPGAPVRIWYTLLHPGCRSLSQKSAGLIHSLFQRGHTGMQADKIDVAVERLRLFIPVLQRARTFV